MKKVFLLALVSCCLHLEAQNSLTVDGYVKLLGTFNHVNQSFLPPEVHSLFPETSQDYQIHNRFNIRWYGKKNWSAVLGMRNQLYWGYQVENMPNYGDFLEDDGFFNLSTYWSNDKSYLRVFFDRLFLQYQNDNWKLRLGRQRINWGVNTTFNPNDLFNQYNYFDFDYEERPGVDALFAQRYLGSYSSIEAAFTPGADSLEQSVGAVLYRLNKWNTDMQVLAGYYLHDIAIGAGFASNFLWGSSLKGEFTQFVPIDETVTEANFTLSSAWEYSFKGGLMLTLGWVFNDNGTLSPTVIDQIQITTSDLTAKNIFPYKHTLLISGQYQFTDLLSGSLAWMQTPDFSNAFAVPQLSYSLTQDLDVLLLAQLFFADNFLKNNQWDYFSTLFFIRLKYSF